MNGPKNKSVKQFLKCVTCGKLFLGSCCLFSVSNRAKWEVGGGGSSDCLCRFIFVLSGFILFALSMSFWPPLCFGHRRLLQLYSDNQEGKVWSAEVRNRCKQSQSWFLNDCLCSVWMLPGTSSSQVKSTLQPWRSFALFVLACVKNPQTPLCAPECTDKALARSTKQ